MATSPPIPSVDTFTPTPIGMRPSAACFAGADESGESGVAAVRRSTGKVISSNSRANRGILRMVAPQEKRNYHARKREPSLIWSNRRERDTSSDVQVQGKQPNLGATVQTQRFVQE